MRRPTPRSTAHSTVCNSSGVGGRGWVAVETVAQPFQFMEAKNEYRIEGGVVWIKLTQGKETCVDLKDWPKVAGHRWYAHKHGRTFYARTNTYTGSRHGNLKLHRVLLPGSRVDHEDGNGLNNLLSNLRSATAQQNQGNARLRSDNSTGFKGVTYYERNGKFGAQIRVSGKNKFLGLFLLPEEAACAYDTAAKKYFGEFARINFA